jgi:hypothetical protein
VPDIQPCWNKLVRYAVTKEGMYSYTTMDKHFEGGPDSKRVLKENRLTFSSKQSFMEKYD